MHPGWVLTDMGGPNAKLTVEDSVSAMLNTISAVGEEHNGKFIQFDGQEIPY